MSIAQVISNIQTINSNLISAANNATGESRSDLTSAVADLIGGYGKSDDGYVEVDPTRRLVYKEFIDGEWVETEIRELEVGEVVTLKQGADVPEANVGTARYNPALTFKEWICCLEVVNNTITIPDYVWGKIVVEASYYAAQDTYVLNDGRVVNSPNNTLTTRCYAADGTNSFTIPDSCELAVFPLSRKPFSEWQPSQNAYKGLKSSSNWYVPFVDRVLKNSKGCFDSNFVWIPYNTTNYNNNNEFVLSTYKHWQNVLILNVVDISSKQLITSLPYNLKYYRFNSLFLMLTSNKLINGQENPYFFEDSTFGSLYFTGSPFLKEISFNPNQGKPNSGYTTLMPLVPDWVFTGKSYLRKVTLPDSVETIGLGAFYGSACLYDFHWPASLKIIGALAFVGCLLAYGNEVFKVPEGVTTIGTSAFYTSDSVNKNIVIPESVTFIGKTAFNIKTNNKVRFKSMTPPVMEDFHTFNNYNNFIDIYVPEAAVNTYNGATNYVFYNIYPDTHSSMPDNLKD